MNIMNVPEYHSSLGRNPQEAVIVSDVTGREHTLLAEDALMLYEALESGFWDANVWLSTRVGVVRYGALAWIDKP